MKAALTAKTEYEENNQKTKKRSTTNGETLIHLLKGNIGSGCFSIPAAFKNSGLWVGVFGIPFLGAICLHCMHLILNSSRELRKRTNLKNIGYEEAAELAFKTGPESIRKWTSVVKYCITTFLVVTQMGFCCVYFVFVSQNFYQAIECLSGGTGISQFGYMAIVLIPVLLICYIPDLKLLAPVSMVAATLEIIGIFCIYYYTIRDLPSIQTEVQAFGGWSTLPLFFSAAIFAFEGIGLVLPLEGAMGTPKTFGTTYGVLNTGIYITMLIYTSLGFYGYLYYGNNILGSITLNLPGDEILGNMVKIFIGTAIFLTYPLQFYVPLSVILPSLLRKFSSQQAKFICEYLTRTVLVLITFILAAVIPNIGLFINLIGAVSASAIALIFPPIIDTVTFWPDTGKHNFRLIKNGCVLFVGLLGFVTGTYSSLKDIIHFFAEGDSTITTGC